MTLSLATVSSPRCRTRCVPTATVAPDVRIDVSFQTVDAYQAAVRTRIGGGNPPDIVGVWPGNGNAMAVHQIAPLGRARGPLRRAVGARAARPRRAR